MTVTRQPAGEQTSGASHKGQVQVPGRVPGLQALFCARSHGAPKKHSKCCEIHSTEAATWLALTDTVHGRRASLDPTVEPEMRLPQTLSLLHSPFCTHPEAGAQATPSVSRKKANSAKLIPMSSSSRCSLCWKPNSRPEGRGQHAPGANPG